MFYYLTGEGFKAMDKGLGTRPSPPYDTEASHLDLELLGNIGLGRQNYDRLVKGVTSFTRRPIVEGGSSFGYTEEDVKESLRRLFEAGYIGEVEREELSYIEQPDTIEGVIDRRLGRMRSRYKGQRGLGSGGSEVGS